MSLIDGLFDSAMLLYSGIMSNGTYDIVRPDYTNSQSLEQTIARQVGVPIDVAKGEIEAKIAGVDYYVVGLPSSRVEVGDVIVPSPARAGVPAVTVRSKDGGGKDLIAFRTDQIGSILLSTRGNKEKYENVRYGTMSMLNPEGAIVPEFESSPEFVMTRLAFFSREDIRVGMYLLLQNGRHVVFRSVETIGPIVTVVASEKKP